MDNLLNFPQTTLVGINVPKIAFYARSTQKTWLKDVLASEFDSITWLYKLTSDTVNMVDGKNVHEIDIFLCRMKGNHYSIDPFCKIDQLIPRHTIFIVKYGEHYDLLMRYKEKALVRGEEQWSQGETELLGDVKPYQVNLQLEGQDMDSIYEGLLGQISGLHTHGINDYEQAAADRKTIMQLQEQVESLEKDIRKEKYLAKKIELRNQQREAQAQINKLNNK